MVAKSYHNYEFYPLTNGFSTWNTWHPFKRIDHPFGEGMSWMFLKLQSEIRGEECYELSVVVNPFINSQISKSLKHGTDLVHYPWLVCYRIRIAWVKVRGHDWSVNSLVCLTSSWRHGYYYACNACHELSVMSEMSLAMVLDILMIAWLLLCM